VEITPLDLTLGLSSYNRTQRNGEHRIIDTQTEGHIVLEENITTSSYNLPARRIEYDLDTTKGYLISGLTVVSKDLMMKVRVKLLEEREVSKGLWVPVKIEVQNIIPLRVFDDLGVPYPSKPDEEGFILNATIIMQVEEVNLTSSIPEGFFSLEFPEGTLVDDEVRRVQYNVGGGVPRPRTVPDEMLEYQGK